MSQQSQASHATPSTAPLNTETINELAGKLQEVAETLLARTQGEPPEPDDETEEDTSKPKKEPDQIRCYRVPDFITRYEKEVLEEYQADGLVELLRKARDEFHLTSFFLRNFRDEVEVNSFMLQLIGESLSHPINILNKLSSIMVDYSPHSFDFKPSA